MPLSLFNYLVLFLIFIPIFFGYDFQEATFVTDINILVSERVLSFPSFPVGIGIVLVGFFLTLKERNLIQFVSLNLFFWAFINTNFFLHRKHQTFCLQHFYFSRVQCLFLR